MINIFEVKETNNMVEHENLDVRTITIGISLLSCIDSDLKKLNENIYNRITSVAKDLAKVAGEIEAEYGIPIVNKRISVTPIALIGGAACKTPEDFATIADTMDRAAEAIGADLIGGYSALVSKGMTKADEMLIRSIPIALCRTNRVCSSVNLASTKTGINMDAVRLMGEILLEVAERSKDRDSVDCMKLVVFCNAPDDNPFMAGAFHGVTDSIFSRINRSWLRFFLRESIRSTARRTIPLFIKLRIETLYLSDSHKGILHMPLQQQRDALAGSRRHFCYVFTKDFAHTTLRAQIAHQNVDCRSFSCTVLSEESQDASFRHIKRQIVIDNPPFTIALRQPLDGDYNLFFHLLTLFTSEICAFEILNRHLYRRLVCRDVWCDSYRIRSGKRQRCRF